MKMLESLNLSIFFLVAVLFWYQDIHFLISFFLLCFLVGLGTRFITLLIIIRKSLLPVSFSTATIVIIIPFNKLSFTMQPCLSHCDLSDSYFITRVQLKFILCNSFWPFILFPPFDICILLPMNSSGFYTFFTVALQAYLIRYIRCQGQREMHQQPVSQLNLKS